MRLKTKYILFIVTVHLICLVLSYFAFRQHKVLFMVSELFIIASVLVSIGLYAQLIRPLVSLKEGVHAIMDRDFNVKFRPTGKREMDELIDVYNQMIDELRKERTKQEEQHFFLEKLIQTSPTGIVILDYNHQVKQINPKALDILGDKVGIFMEQAGQLKAGESKMLRFDGPRTYRLQKSHFMDRGFARFFLMIEEMTSVIFEAEKNVYGKVIRMMAHEVNNTIGPVNSILNLTLQTGKIWEGDGLGPLKDALNVAVDRNQHLNLFMRNFAELVKLPQINRRELDIVSLLRSVAVLMGVKAGEAGIIFGFQLPEKPVLIMADVEQLEQAMINIVKNAIEACENEGRVTFRVNEAQRSIEISDTGTGISPELGEQLFSPFFSTKKDGKGIGLTLVREVLINHNFEFSLRTVRPGQTDFIIFY